jgi:hypothetical protein
MSARIDLAETELRGFAGVDPGLDAIHEYGARNPKECLSAMSFAFQSEEFTTRYHVPSYADWLARSDFRPAYEMHRLVLQILQRRFAGGQWVVKSPVHMRALPTVLAVYPDARVVVTHRDPLRFLQSLTSLVATLRAAHTDAVDYAAIGAFQTDLWQGNLDRLVTWTDDGTLDPARVHHGSYSDFMQDALGAVGALYDHFGLTFGDATAQRMRDHLDAHPQGEHGSHAYSFEDLGLDPDATRARFARYQARFSVPSEGG